MEITKKYKYFSVSERDKKWGAYILNTGYFKFPENFEYAQREHPPHHYFQWNTGRTLHEFQLIYLIEGKGEFESNATGRINIYAGQCILLFPGIWHRYRPKKNSPWTTYWIGCDGQLIRNILKENFLNSSKPVIDIGYDEKIIKVFKIIEEISEKELAGYQQILSGILVQLFGQIFAIQHRLPFMNSGHENIIQKAKILLQESLSTPVKVESIADKLGISYSLFRRLFKQYTDISPNQYFIQLRIEKAKELLYEQNMSIKEVAFELGFETVYYFTRLFKSKTGITPTQFKGK